MKHQLQTSVQEYRYLICVNGWQNNNRKYSRNLLISRNIDYRDQQLLQQQQQQEIRK